MHTHIYFLLDRTGSMNPMVDDVVGGFNTFLAEQRAEGDDARMTLVQFDSQDPFEVMTDAVSLAKVPELTVATFQPRGMTPLLDATGDLIAHAAERVEKRNEAGKKPESIVVVTFTDGEENASHRRHHQGAGGRQGGAGLDLRLPGRRARRLRREPGHRLLRRLGPGAAMLSTSGPCPGHRGSAAASRSLEGLLRGRQGGRDRRRRRRRRVGVGGGGCRPLRPGGSTAGPGGRRCPGGAGRTGPIRDLADAPADVLIVAEAGQLSLADTPAATRHARNLILLGDPLQLAQVSLASHPGGGGASVLEHLLGGEAVLPPDRGVFLHRRAGCTPTCAGSSPPSAPSPSTPPGRRAHLSSFDALRVSGTDLLARSQIRTENPRPAGPSDPLATLVLGSGALLGCTPSGSPAP